VSFSRGLKRFCKRASIPYKSPHKLRNGHGVYGVKVSQKTEEYKVFSQNMGHESMDITDRLYGKLAGDDVKKIIMTFSENTLPEPGDKELFRQFSAFKKWMGNQDKAIK